METARESDRRGCVCIGQHAPIFIGGQRRSGTTLMLTMLNRHPHIASVPQESHFLQDERFELFFRDLLEWHSKRFEQLGITPSELDRAVAALIDRLFMPHQVDKGALRWLEKTPRNILRIDYLFRLFPDAQFIHMIRDPRDTLFSMKQRTLVDRPGWVKFTAKKTAREWVACIAAGLPWRAHPARYLEVRYEQLAQEPEAEMRRVLAFLGEPWFPAVLDAPAAPAQDAHRGQNEERPVFSTSIGGWRKGLSTAEVARIRSIAGETMALLGYQQEVV
jgi:hypothetical protein